MIDIFFTRPQDECRIFYFFSFFLMLDWKMILLMVVVRIRLLDIVELTIAGINLESILKPISSVLKQHYKKSNFASYNFILILQEQFICIFKLYETIKNRIFNNRNQQHLYCD